MELIAEGFGCNSKAAVDGVNSYWVEGETVRINGIDKIVSVDGTRAYISDVPSADTYRALYPDSLNNSATLLDDEVTVLIPRTYTYMESNGLQRLGAPMAAYGTNEDRLLFKHLTAALTIEIKNNYGFTIQVDNVVVESNNYQLCGSKTITLAGNMSVAANKVGVDTADKRVKVCFNGGTALQVLSGETRRVQVPVLPVGNDNRFTIRVGVHKVDDGNVKCLFERTQGEAQASYALARARMGYAGVTFGKPFSIGNGKQVIISQGNLQYVPSTNEWSFHTHQYDICEIGSGSYESTRYTSVGTEPIDLFGFGTSGYNEKFPYMTSPTASDYSTTTPFAKSYYDWGYYNDISNGGVGQWYTLPSNKWTYIFRDRPDDILGVIGAVPVKYTFATIELVHKGIILFPDHYIHPEDATATLIGATFNTNTDYTTAVSYSDWYKMEAAGAVFLPAAGYRSNNGTTATTYILSPNQGMYWTGSDNAYSYVFNSVTAPTSRQQSRHYGMSVRVVKDIE